MRDFLNAFRLLTILPVPGGELRAGDTGRAAGWFPAVGLCLGALPALVFVLLGPVAPPPLQAAMTLAVWIALTGGLHLDGLGDSFDGLGYAGSRERRLEIMRDPRIGAFGVTGLALILLLKYSSLLSIASGRAPAAILLGAGDAILILGLLVAHELGYRTIPVIELAEGDLASIPLEVEVSIAESGEVSWGDEARL